MSFLQCVQTMSCWEALHTVWSQSCAIKFKPTTSELPVSSGKGNVRVPWVSRRRTESRTLWWRNERSWSPCWADARQAGPESERCTGSRKKKEETSDYNMKNTGQQQQLQLFPTDPDQWLHSKVTTFHKWTNKKKTPPEGGGATATVLGLQQR